MTIQSVSQSPVLNGFSITPSDTVELKHPIRGIYVGVSGDVTVLTINDDIITMVGLAAGMWHPCTAKMVYSTGTTATDILGGY